MTAARRALQPLLLLATLAGIAACMAHEEGPSARTPKSKAAGNAVYAARQTNAGNAEAQVNLLARAFLPPGSEAHAGFAYYAYLVFSDSSPTTAPARRAASAFYLSMLDHVSPAGDKPSIRRETMAVLYVPLTDKAAANALMTDRDPQGLLSTYDYVRVRALLRSLKRAGKTVPDVAIVGSTHALPTTGALDASAVDVVDLTDPGTVSERMERFRDAFQAGERHVREDGQPIVLKRLRDYFAWAEAAEHDGPRSLTF